MYGLHEFMNIHLIYAAAKRLLSSQERNERLLIVGAPAEGSSSFCRFAVFGYITTQLYMKATSFSISHQSILTVAHVGSLC